MTQVTLFCCYVCIPLDVGMTVSPALQQRQAGHSSGKAREGRPVVGSRPRGDRRVVIGIHSSAQRVSACPLILYPERTPLR